MLFAAEAVVAHELHGALDDAALVLRAPNARRVDGEATRLRVLEKRLDDARRGRAGDVDDGLRVVGDERLEDAAVEGPGGLAGLDGGFRRLALDDVDEAVARQGRREDEGLLVHAAEAPHEARVDLQLGTSGRVDDANGVSSSTELELLRGEAVQRRIRHEHIAPLEELPDFGELDAVVEPLLDDVAVLIAAAPRLAVWPVVSALLSLVKRFGVARVDDAARRALDADMHDVDRLRRMIEAPVVDGGVPIARVLPLARHLRPANTWAQKPRTPEGEPK